ncbi:MAG: D-TA family PLP-dependent enzyme [Christensenellaceae bacterium]|nr:D-TA family PLP-dependent enzyme [Christensenellaceae bacterium]
MKYTELDTPVVIIDKDIMMSNIKFMQDYANRKGVALRPHTKTHKIPEISLLCEAAGAKGITVAKVGEAEVMAAAGLKDIFIANEIVGEEKFKRIIKLAETIDISFGLDSIEQANLINKAFEGVKPAEVVIEIEVGENRSGMLEEDEFINLLNHLKDNCPNINLRGVFSHDGSSYNAKDIEECKEIHLTAQKRTLQFVEIAKGMGYNFSVVSIGSTPSMLFDFPILEGVTEIRPGTYVLMDASMSAAYGNLDMAAVTVLATVISRPTAERVILDVGAKGITMQTRTKGITAVKGMGIIKNFDDVHIFDVFDEHAIIYNKKFRDTVRVGDKVEIIPVHVCPMMNLYNKAYVVQNGEVIDEYVIAGRGKLQ